MSLRATNQISRSDQNLNGIDLVKFICSIFVCVVHLPPFANVLPIERELNFWLQNCVARFAVPFFFTAAGFLFFRKRELYDQSPDALKIYCFKLLRLLGLWFVILLVGRNVQLWYFGSLLTATLLLYFLLRKKVRLGYIIAIAAVLYTIGLLGDTYYFIFAHFKKITVINLISILYENTMGGTRNGIFFGFIFVLMGALIAHKKIRINIFAAAAGLVVSAGMLALEFTLIRKYLNLAKINMYISLLPLIFFLFVFAAQLKLPGKDFFIRLRIIGVLVFFMHMAVYNFVKLLINAAGKYAGVNLDFIRFLSAVLITIVLAALIEWLSRKEKFRWLRYLYS